MNYFKVLIYCLSQASLQTQNWQCLLIIIASFCVRAYNQTNCTMSISRWRTAKVFEAFSIFLLVTGKIYIEYLPIFVTWESLREEVFERSKTPHTLWRNDNPGLFWLSFLQIGTQRVLVYWLGKLNLRIKGKQGNEIRKKMI